jgi:hypothetical protein
MLFCKNANSLSKCILDSLCESYAVGKKLLNFFFRLDESLAQMSSSELFAHASTVIDQVPGFRALILEAVIDARFWSKRRRRNPEGASSL